MYFIYIYVYIYTHTYIYSTLLTLAYPLSTQIRTISIPLARTAPGNSPGWANFRESDWL